MDIAEGYKFPGATLGIFATGLALWDRMSRHRPSVSITAQHNNGSSRAPGRAVASDRPPAWLRTRKITARHCDTMKNLRSKGELLARIKSPSRSKRANAVRLLLAAYHMTQREIVKASGKSLGWVSAMSRNFGRLSAEARSPARLPLTTAANAAKLSFKPLISLVGAP